MDQRVEIIITPDGKIRIDTQGFTGPECQKAAEAVVRILNARIQEEQKKPEYYLDNVIVESAGTHQQVRGRVVGPTSD